MNEDSGQVRLFAAIELPDAWLGALGKVIAQLERVGGNEFKWVRSELMHLTLLFLGYQDEDSVPAIVGGLEAAAAANRSFDLNMGHLGGFGPPHALSVLWAGLEGSPREPQMLHRSVAESLAAAGISFDRKPLVPHVTLARGRRPVNRDASLRVAAVMKQIELPRLAATFDSFVLMRSRLSPRGPSYEVVHRFLLAGGHGH